MYLEFQNQIDETMFLAQQKAELCLGELYVPRKVLVRAYISDYYTINHI